MAGVIFFVIGVCTIFGWIAILMCIFGESSISEGINSNDFIAQTASIGLWSYTAPLVAYIGIGFVYKEKGDLPPMLQYIGGFMHFKDVELTHASRMESTIDLKAMASEAQASASARKHEPAWKKMVRAKQYRKPAEELRVEEEVLKAETEMHKASRRYNQAKAEAEANRKKKK